MNHCSVTVSVSVIYREFLDTFDVGGIPDGKVTPVEFLNYYSNVSSSIDNDDYFELMMRNAWHISGGEGWCANSSCLRVLCKHADGHETVEEMKVGLSYRIASSLSTNFPLEISSTNSNPQSHRTTLA